MTPLSELHARLQSARAEHEPEAPGVAHGGDPQNKRHLKPWAGDTGPDKAAWLRDVVSRFQLGKAQPRTERPTVEVRTLQPPPQRATGGVPGETIAKVPRGVAPAPGAYHPKATDPSTRRPTMALPTLGKGGAVKLPDGSGFMVGTVGKK